MQNWKHHKWQDNETPSKILCVAAHTKPNNRLSNKLLSALCWEQFKTYIYFLHVLCNVYTDTWKGGLFNLYHRLYKCSVLKLCKHHDTMIITKM